MLLVLWALPRAYRFGLSLYNISTLKVLEGNSIPGYLSPEGGGETLADLPLLEETVFILEVSSRLSKKLKILPRND